VKTFLHTWLVAGDIDGAFGWFSTDAFLNRALLAESCVSGIETTTRSEDTRARVKRFLSDFSKDKADNVNSVVRLDVLRRAAGWHELKNRAANRPDEDHFVVFKATRDEAARLGDTAAQRNYLKKSIPTRTVEVVLIPIYDGVLYTIWVPESDRMAIYHLGMFCM
jgi:hypothetical protein